MIILKIIALILLVLLAVLLVLLLTPVRYSAKGYKYEDYNITAEGSWIFGILKFIFCKHEGQRAAFSLELFYHPLKFKQKKHEEEKEKIKKEGQKQNRAKRFLDRGYRNQFLKMVKAVFNNAKPYMMSARGRFGFEDPFDTAMVWGFLSCLNITGEKINISPVFDDEILKGEFEIRGRIILFKLLVAFVIFRFSKPVKYIIKNERMEKKYAS